ncbi:MAG TPA: hypothetical protein VID74_00050, partial [Gemmatimonadales bacterium]
MKRRTFVQQSGAALALSFLPRQLPALQQFSRRRPGDANWPSAAAWNRLKAAVDGNLVPVPFPLGACMSDVDGA